jgi:hypothetical protein
MTFTVERSIDEQDVAASLTQALQEVKRQNKVCIVLTKFSVEGLGTAQARVVLTFDDAKCKRT